ncbi:alpha/beta hydrolase [Lacticaseibacillus sharpeae]|uniref:Family S9 peptidase n=1 Tax=Lacticaseibacillus sharpeae JCM 1186 = DSM 20505 TaxID=1291052 RepID=A0A0R1ZLN5_9LACO|nr:alpha/beta hydrolase [Lacticaseibacillus sharpeae]KRM55905.1 family S9 peptidase [Lacticaseibacillus sharpeae JCM 1186 = DSM 20505]
MKLWLHKHRAFIRVLTILVVIIGGAYVGACEYFYRVAFIPSQKSFLSTKQSASKKSAIKWLAEVPHSVWHETAVGKPSWQLNAWYVPAAKQTSKTIVVAHGYMNTHKDMAEYIRMFHDAGYNVLAPDDRGHGSSDGTYVGYGWADRLDYRKWLRRVVRVNGQQSDIGLFGVSMGGATVMYLSGMNLPKQVHAIVEDCGYTSVDAEISYQAGSMYNLPRWPLVPGTLTMAHLHTRIDYAAANAVSALHRNQLPTFFIHGAKDKFVPTTMVHQNYAASRGPKQLWVVPGAGHAQSYGKHTAEYTKRVTKFFAKHL